jgi:hypothetical protein
VSISAKEKELTAVGISVATGYKPRTSSGSSTWPRKRQPGQYDDLKEGSNKDVRDKAVVRTL